MATEKAPRVGPQIGAVARVVVVADRHSEVLERGQRIAMCGLDMAQAPRPLGADSSASDCRCLVRSPGPGAGRHALGRDQHSLQNLAFEFGAARPTSSRRGLTTPSPRVLRVTASRHIAGDRDEV